MSKLSGIYQITNKVNGHRYIGSSCNIYNRFYQHKSGLRNDKHCNPYLQSAWNKYGEGAFTFKPLMYCDSNMMLFYEQQCLDTLKPEYNFAKDANAPMRGTRFSEEHKRKISEALIGIVRSEETRNKISEGNKGKHVISEETRKKLSDAKIGRLWSEENKMKLRGKNSHNYRKAPWNKGRTDVYSEETRMKMSASRKANWDSKKQLGEL